ncbi:MAG: DUF2344 domain-containing protein [Chloroflexi bacterium]|nr:DUF2344 domain-containing protein [Chloroflexota bacterium]
MHAPVPSSSAEPRQRWRLGYGRSANAPRLAQRDQNDAWEQSLVGSGLPVAGLDLDPPRPRIVFAAPIGVGVAAEHELADLFLTDRRSVAEVREALELHMPAGHSLTGLHDVWLGAPPLPGRVEAADYRARIATDDGSRQPDAMVDLAVLRHAAVGLLAAGHLPRTRHKGGRVVAYDLRPLIARVDVRGVTVSLEDGAIAELCVRVRFDSERGVGRPEDVLAAIADSAGVQLLIVSLVRERIVLTGVD